MSQAGNSPTRKLPPMAAGQRYGRLLAIERIGGKAQRYPWRLQCDCGNETITTADKVRSGHTASCGCLHQEALKKHEIRSYRHGHARKNHATAEYKIWAGIIARSCNPKKGSFKNYGGRGITVCDRWLTSFKDFYTDMGPRPSGYSIERKNNNLGYSPENCIWIPRNEQARNTRRNHIVYYAGKQLILEDACRLAGINSKVVHRRLGSGWNIDRALSTPVRSFRKTVFKKTSSNV